MSFLTRSMRIDDIPGASPQIRQFHKRSYRDKHEQQITKFKRPYLDLMGDVYLQSRSQRFQDGMPNFISNVYNTRGSGFSDSKFGASSSVNPERYGKNSGEKLAKADLSKSILNEGDDSPRKINKSMSLKPDPSDSNSLQRNLSSNHKFQSQKKMLNRNAILSENGLKSLTSKSKVLQDNPYFPQIYSDQKEIFQPSTKLTGNRYWNGSPTKSITIQKGNGTYYPKWP